MDSRRYVVMAYSEPPEPEEKIIILDTMKAAGINMDLRLR